MTKLGQDLFALAVTITAAALPPEDSDTDPPDEYNRAASVLEDMGYDDLEEDRKEELERLDRDEQ